MHGARCTVHHACTCMQGMRGSGRQAWQQVVHRSRCDVSRRFVTSPAYMVATPRAELTGTRAPTPLPLSNSRPGASSASSSTLAPPRRAGGAGDGCGVRPCSACARRSSLCSLMRRKTSSSVVHETPYSATPREGRLASSSEKTWRGVGQGCSLGTWGCSLGAWGCSLGTQCCSLGA